MKNYRSYFKANLKLLLSVLGIMLLFDAAIIMSGIENRFNGEFLISMIIFLGVTAAVMALLCMLIVRTANKMIPVAKIIDEKGMCPEAIEKYRQLHPKMGAKEHCVLASYYLAMEDTDSAENELTAAGQLQMYDTVTEVYYSELFTQMRLKQRRLYEAALMHNNHLSVNRAYCKAHPGAIAVEHYSNGALLEALNGNMGGSMDNINAMEKSIKKIRKLAFSRNTVLMGVYLIMRDYVNADSIKDRMLKDIETFDRFDLKSDKQLIMQDIRSMQTMFDERTWNKYQ